MSDRVFSGAAVTSEGAKFSRPTATSKRFVAGLPERNASRFPYPWGETTISYVWRLAPARRSNTHRIRGASGRTCTGSRPVSYRHFYLVPQPPAIGCYLFRIEPMNAGSPRYTNPVPRRYIHAAGDGLSRSCNIRLPRYLPHFQAFRSSPSPTQTPNRLPSLPSVASSFHPKAKTHFAGGNRGHGEKSVPDKRVSQASSLRLFIFMRVERFRFELHSATIM